MALYGKVLVGRYLDRLEIQNPGGQCGYRPYLTWTELQDEVQRETRAGINFVGILRSGARERNMRLSDFLVTPA